MIQSTKPRARRVSMYKGDPFFHPHIVWAVWHPGCNEVVLNVDLDEAIKRLHANRLWLQTEQSRLTAC